MKSKLLAQASEIIGSIDNPLSESYGDAISRGGSTGGGLILFFTNIVRLLFVVGGLWAFFNFIIAGFVYMGAAGDPKKLDEAWKRIWMTLLGLVVLVGSFALASIFSLIVFGEAGFILNPVIYGPGE